jgi:hypothetical protein
MEPRQKDQTRLAREFGVIAAGAESNTGTTPVREGYALSEARLA